MLIRGCMELCEDRRRSLKNCATSSVKGARDHPWPHILPEILTTIMDLLPPTDAIQLRWVCSSWRSIVTNDPKKDPITFKLPLLAIQRLTGLSFYTPFSDKFLQLQLPPHLTTHRCCGSHEGWLVMLCEVSLKLIVVHPVSRAHFNLPSEPNCFLVSKYENPPICRVQKVVLSAPPTDADCKVAVMVGFNVILICRVGDVEWSVFDGGMYGSAYEDIVFHKGMLCVVECTGKVSIMGVDSRLRVSAPVVVKALKTGGWSVKHRYLVDGVDELLLVVKTYHARKMEFLVYKRDGERWVALEWFDDWCLFIGTVRSELVSVEDFRGMKGNCVYFTSKLASRVAPDGVGYYCMEDEEVEPIALPRDADSCFLSEPVWVKRTLY